MPIVTISATYPILSNNGSARMPCHTDVDFNVGQGKQAVAVSIFRNEIRVRAEIQQHSLSDAVLDWLKSLPKHSNYPAVLSDEIEGIATRLEGAARTVVETIKYLLFRPGIPDGLIGLADSFFCVDEDGNKFDFPLQIFGSLSSHSSLPLQAEISADLQTGFDKGYLPLAGMRHLLRAIQEEEPRFKWIDATIALELCIKEALIRKRPEVETLLLEMPSPPLHKLYGSIMKETFGVKSPCLKAIGDGVTTRNKLVHRPTGVMISKAEAATYVQVAHQAIVHLSTSPHFQ